MSTPIPKFYCAPSYDHAYFERLYLDHVDPWSVLTSAYERNKFEATVDALVKPTYEHVLELGCSIGGLTKYLAPRCNALTAVDTSAVALRRAREWCPEEHVRFVQAHLPDGDWGGTYDLVVLSEVLYYFTIPALAHLAGRLTQVVSPTTTFVVTHWIGETDYPLTGDHATELFQLLIGAKVQSRARNAFYLMETWELSDGATPTEA